MQAGRAEMSNGECGIVKRAPCPGARGSLIAISDRDPGNGAHAPPSLYSRSTRTTAAATARSVEDLIAAEFQQANSDRSVGRSCSTTQRDQSAQTQQNQRRWFWREGHIINPTGDAGHVGAVPPIDPDHVDGLGILASIQVTPLQGAQRDSIEEELAVPVVSRPRHDLDFAKVPPARQGDGVEHTAGASDTRSDTSSPAVPSAH